MKSRGKNGRFQVTLTTRVCVPCGQEFKPRTARQLYCSRKCAYTCSALRGRDNPRYKGGLSKLTDGRSVICCTDGTMMLFYRAVMEAELRRPLTDDEIVHHLNGDHTDDRVENLAITTRADHIEIHRGDLMAGRKRKAVAA